MLAASRGNARSSALAALIAIACPVLTAHAQVEIRDRGGLELPSGAAFLASVPGSPRLVWIDPAGAVASVELDPASRALKSTEGAERWTLPDPSRTLLDLGAIEADGEPGLVRLGPRGLYWHPLDDSGRPIEEGTRLARRAQFGLRVGEPRGAELLRDLDGDGGAEIVVPTLDGVSLWRRTGDDLRYSRAIVVDVPVQVVATASRGDLTDRLFTRVEIPGIDSVDLNGDGREDLVLNGQDGRAYHLARPDGSFAETPDRTVDLALFRDDTSAGSRVVAGETLRLGATASLTRRDLDGDGIPDHVVTAGRKVWVFRANSGGPQFEEPSTILKSGDDVTAAAIVELDADGAPDLLLLRLELPSVATLVVGIVRDFEVELNCSGYRNEGEGRFATRPAWSSTIRFRIPPLRQLIGDPYSLLESVRETVSVYRSLTFGDFDGDGTTDLAAIDADGGGFELWLEADADSGALSRAAIDATAADVLFGEGSKVWTVERVLEFLGAQTGDRLLRATGGRAPDAGFDLEDEAGQLEELLALEIGAGDAVLVGVLREPSGAERLTVFEVDR